MGFPFGKCEGGEHAGQLKWEPYSKHLQGMFTDKLPRGVIRCTVCLETVDFGVPDPRRADPPPKLVDNPCPLCGIDHAKRRKEEQHG